MSNPLEAYISCTRLVFSVEPSEPSEEWGEFEEFEEKLCYFYESLQCNNCNNLLIDPCAPKKQHISCQHRVCLDCIGKNRMTAVNCKFCRDFTLYEKSNQTKLVLKLFQELCELIKGSWIYDYIQRRKKPDTGQKEKLNLTEIIENGINYGQVPIVVEDSSSSSSSSSSGAMSGDENSNSSMIKDDDRSLEKVPYSNQKTVLTSFPSISSQASISPKIVQSPVLELPPVQPIAVLPVDPIQQTTTIVPIVSQTTSINTTVLPPPPIAQVVSQNLINIPLIQPSTSVQSAAPQQILPSTSKIIPNPSLLKSSPSYISSPPPPPPPMQNSPMRVKSTMQAKSIMSPIKIQQQQQQTTPTIYSVMYTGNGNKIMLKRKAPNDEQSTSLAINESTSFNCNSSSNNLNLLKTENTTIGSNFKSPLVQMTNNNSTSNNNAIQPMINQQQQQMPIVTTPSQQAANNQHTQNLSNSNDKRRGCRCGNATAAPGKLTCCGQRCPCYVDSKACIDCKCRGCRNPHYADGQKKMRHQVLDFHAQQQQQQNFLATIQQQTAMLKEVHKSSSISLMKTEDINLIEQSTTAMTTTTTMISKNSINNCIISMNSNGQYEIKPRIIVKDPVKTPLIFPTTSMPITTISGNSSSIQIVGLYSQVPMTSPSNVVAGCDKKIIIKNEQAPGTVVAFTDSKPHLLESSATNFNTNNNLNSNLL